MVKSLIQPIIRLGMPKTTGSLWHTAKQLNAPTLISAGCLWNHQRRRFRLPGRAIEGHDVALDSAGFIAHTHWGGFPWSPSQYARVAASYPWAWWAQMDCAVEPELANNQTMRTYRIHHTARLLEECIHEAGRLRIKKPIPVLQGWHPLDYEQSFEHADRIYKMRWPKLVGVGSICRRQISGKDGIASIISHIHEMLPTHCGLHLFGVKSGALQLVRQIATGRNISTDSQAWGIAARQHAFKNKVSCTNELKSEAMITWYTKQQQTYPTQAPLLIPKPKLTGPFFWEACCFKPSNIRYDSATDEYDCASCGASV